MSAIQFGWVGATSKKIASTLLEELVKEWHLAWRLPGAAKSAPIHRQGSEQGLVARSAGGAVLLSLGQSDASMLGELLAGVSEPGKGGSLAALVGAEAMNDLAGRILRRASIPAPVDIEDVPWPPSLVDPRLGSLTCHIQVESLAFDIAVDRTVLTALVGKREAKAGELEPPLDGRGEALTDVEILLDVAMDFGSTSLDHVTHLKVGDVLVADAKLSDLALLRTQDGRRLAAGVITERAGKLAITLRDALPG